MSFTHALSRVLLPSLAVPLFLFAASKTNRPVDLTFSDLNGGKVRLSDYRGKIVVLNFRATWCGPCLEETPLLVDAERTWTSKGVVFLGASLDDKDTRGNIPEFAQKCHVAYPILTEATLDHLAKLHLGNAVPDTVFLDESGIIVARVEGQIRKDELTERIEWLYRQSKISRATALLSSSR